jgi:hypothetical protein
MKADIALIPVVDQLRIRASKGMGCLPLGSIGVLLGFGAGLGHLVGRVL